MRRGYDQGAADPEGWRDPPAPLAAISSDPRLDANAPTKEWARGAIRDYLAGATTVDDLYKAAYELLGYRSRQSERRPQSDLDRDLVYSFIDAFCSMCLMAVVHDDEADLKEYLPKWLADLERGEDAWQGPYE
jgi:hypothetical protein